MQAKLFDYASDKIAKSLNKIDKDDVQNVISKFRRKEKVNQNDSSKVNSQEDYCEMLKREFSITDESLKQEQKESTSHELKSESECLRIDEDEVEQENEPEQMMCPFDPDRTSSGEVQSFVQKKNLAQGMMDLALVSANCNQLRYVLDSRNVHPYFLTSLILIICSLTMQVVVGLVLLYSNRFILKRQSEMKAADNCGIIGVYGVFLITLINFLISAFSGSNTVIISSNNENKDDEVV